MTKTKSTSAQVREALSKDRGHYLLPKGAPHANTVYQVVSVMRKDGANIATSKTPKGVLYTRIMSGIVKVEPTVPEYPALGAMLRVTTLGEHPDGSIVIGMRDGERQWVATLWKDGEQ